MSPLRFNSVGHGNGVKVTSNGTVAQRLLKSKVNDNGIIFSNEPVPVNEQVCVKLLELKNEEPNYLFFGFTKRDPKSFTKSRINNSISDFSKMPGLWMKNVGKIHLKKGTTFNFYYGQFGQVRLKVDGVDQGTFVTGVSTLSTTSIWAVFYLVGPSMKIQLVDAHLATSQYLKSSLNWIQNRVAQLFSPSPVQGMSSDVTSKNLNADSALKKSQSSTPRLVTRSSTSTSVSIKAIQTPLRSVHRSSAKQISSSLSTGSQVTSTSRIITSKPIKPASSSTSESCRIPIMPKAGKIPEKKIDSVSSSSIVKTTKPKANQSRLPSTLNKPSNSLVEQNKIEVGPQPSVATGSRLISGSLQFYCPDDLQVNRVSASRNSAENTKNYFFIRQQIKLDHSIVIKIEQIDEKMMTQNSLTFGVTCCNPTRIQLDDLPDDPFLLLDLPGYWVTKMDAIRGAVTNDEICFYFSSKGIANFSRNGDTTNTKLFHFQTCSPLWAFYILNGGISRIRLCGEINRPNQKAISPADKRPVTKRSLLTNEEKGRNKIEFPKPSAPPLDLILMNEEMKDCIICFDNPVNSVVISCGHLCMCFSCAQKYWQVESNCPICRGKINNIIQTFKS